MIDCLGWELYKAEEALKSEGFRVERTEVRSKKGIENGVPFVIKQSLAKERVVRLYFSYIIRDPVEGK